MPVGLVRSRGPVGTEPPAAVARAARAEDLVAVVALAEAMGKLLHVPELLVVGGGASLLEIDEDRDVADKLAGAIAQNRRQAAGAFDLVAPDEGRPPLVSDGGPPQAGAGELCRLPGEG